MTKINENVKTNDNVEIILKLKGKGETCIKLIFPECQNMNTISTSVTMS